MTSPFNPDPMSAIGYFGKVTASISHEIRNALAVINESAGLLGDLTLMAQKGMPIDPERLNRLSETMKGQVKRSDRIVEDMNTFAHGPDESILRFDLDLAVGLATRLAGRMVSAKGGSLEHVRSQVPVRVCTSFFLTQFLIWNCLEQAFELFGGARKIQLSCESGNQKGRVVFTGFEKVKDLPVDKFFKQEQDVIMDNMRAGIHAEPNEGRFTLELPDLDTAEGWQQP